MSIYYPLVKWKSGERTALRRLADATKDQMLPIFELQPTAELEDAEAVAQHRPIRDFCRDVTACWGNTRPFYLDLNYLDRPATTAAVHPILALFRQLHGSGFEFMPVLWSDSSAAMMDVAQQAIAENLTNHVAVRLIEDDSANSTAIIDQITRHLGITRSGVTAILDLELMDSTRSLASTELMLQGWLTNIGMGLNRLILLAGSMPTNLYLVVPQDSVTKLPRQDWRLWTRIRMNPALRGLQYGDYTTVNPTPLGDTSDMRPSAKIKYSLGTEWLIARGQPIWRVGGAQHHVLAGMIVADPGCRAATISYGDQYIRDCAVRTCGPGNPETWVGVSVNQHITFAVSQLLAIPPVP